MRPQHRRYGAFSFSDLSGASNPKGIWGPEYLFLKRAVDSQAPPEEVAEALRVWLKRRNVADHMIRAIFDMTPDEGLKELFKLIGAGLDHEKSPPALISTLRRALNYIVGQHVDQRQAELDAERAELDRMRSRFKEDAGKIVDYLLEGVGPLVRACAACEKEFNVVTPGDNVSHGSCKRHLIAEYQGMEQKFGKSFQSIIDKINARPDSEFPPDLAKQYGPPPVPATQESVSASCKWCDPNPDPTKSYALCKRHLTEWGKQQGLRPDQIEDLITSTEKGEGFPPDLQKPNGARLEPLSPEDRLRYAPGLTIE